MDDMVLQEKPGLFSRIAGIFTHSEEIEDDYESTPQSAANAATQMRPNYRYTVTVRRQITSFDDALAAANGLKRGEQQILNLSATDQQTRQKIVDFMSGVNYAQEGTWEEVGEAVYLIVPANAYVEVAPPTPRMAAVKN
jgi:cell division inhibitor SepF